MNDKSSKPQSSSFRTIHTIQPPQTEVDLNVHQLYLRTLRRSGQDEAIIQQQWQAYYAKLSQEDKIALWNYAQRSTPQAPVSPPPPNYQSPLSNIPLPISPTVVQPNVITDSSQKKPVSTKFPQSGDVRHKLRKAVYWNSSKAMFNPATAQTIRHQNLKSVAFGLLVALVLFLGINFTFWNENYIRPFILPATILNDDASVIIEPAASQINDPSFKVIIPSLGITAPVVSELPARRAENPDETAVQFEDRMQKALEKGVIHYPRTPAPGEKVTSASEGHVNSNVVILGHSSGNLFSGGEFKSIFSNLPRLKLGNFIRVYYNRTQYIYKIYAMETVLPNEVRVLGPAERDHSLTLITCYPPGRNIQRWVIYAQQISPHPDERKGKLISEVLHDGDDTYLPGNPGFFD